MGTPHKATPKQWRILQDYAVCDDYEDSCILELRDRIAALEATATCPHFISSDEGTSYCGLAEQGNSSAGLTGSNHPAKPDSSPAPATQPTPHGYAYLYPSPSGGTVIKFGSGREINGSRPIKAIPYWLGVPPATKSPAAPHAGHVRLAPLLWLLWNHQGSGSPVGQPIRKYLGMGQFQGMTKEQVEAAKSYPSIPFPAQPAAAGGLVMAVHNAIATEMGHGPTEARAAILAVAAWLDQRSYVIANGSQWAERLREEVQRHG